MTVALAAAVSESHEGVSVLVPEDRAFDPDTLARALDALAKYDGQVIVTHPTPPTYINGEWLMIDMRHAAARHDVLARQQAIMAPVVAPVVPVARYVEVPLAMPPASPAPPVANGNGTNGVHPPAPSLAASLLGGAPK